MHCPRCGYQQNSDEIHFCTKCGLAISNVKELLAPEIHGIKKKRKSANNKALRQGLAMMLFGFVMITMLAILRDHLDIPKSFITISALVFCIGGVIRMCAPYLFGANSFADGKADLSRHNLETSKLSGGKISGKTLPEAEFHPLINLGANNFDTSELIPISSVTEVTTRELEKNFKRNKIH